MVDFYQKDTADATGLRLVPKLKFEHIHLTSFSKMRVDLAAPVYTHLSFTHHCTSIKLINYNVFMHVGHE